MHLLLDVSKQCWTAVFERKVIRALSHPNAICLNEHQANILIMYLFQKVRKINEFLL